MPGVARLAGLVGGSAPVARAGRLPREYLGQEEAGGGALPAAGGARGAGAAMTGERV